eukprot:CAMPEP_0118652752 /NCGR_PEP_ID=MMETSP0785-20121206/11478_1 /TAXON_ID=91992 /ORGANISM="Bolidomonas pacifica, Strain CCMP 1866" /LENGTH=545 /DNA_ID=CAMNT_0006545275 /DNA_START=174 /DNA_END=1808 /DNA_ORIENTATION=+
MSPTRNKALRKSMRTQGPMKQRRGSELTTSERGRGILAIKAKSSGVSTQSSLSGGALANVDESRPEGAGDFDDLEEEDDFAMSFKHTMWQNRDFMVYDLPKLEDTDEDEREELFVSKLHLCSLIYSRKKIAKDVVDEFAKEKECQMETILEIQEYVNDPPLDDDGMMFHDVIFANLVNCFEENCFQPMSMYTEKLDAEALNEMKENGLGLGGGSGDTDSMAEKFLEPSWAYWKVIYEIFMKYVNRMKGAIVKDLVDVKFCENLIERFNSTDHRERDMMKTLLLRIYNKFMEHRPQIRRQLNNCFYRFIYETDKHNGITEMLEVLEPIINGFKAPLKQDHLDTLEKSLVPLHKAPFPVFKTYHKQLKKLVNIFMEKDPDKCGAIIIRRLGSFWPLRNGPKQVAMLEELEDILEHISKEMWQEGELAGTRRLLYKLINQVIGSEHFRVAEKGLQLWQNKFLYEGCFNRHVFAREILEVGFYQLYFKSHDHWHNTEGLKDDAKGHGKEIVGCKVGDLAETLKKDYTKSRKSGTAVKGQESNFFTSDTR